MENTVTLEYKNGAGRQQTREIRQVLDIRDYIGSPGYPLLVVAANRHLSVTDIMRFLWEIADGGLPAAERSRSWIQRRRWLFQQPGTVSPNRPRSDGTDERAVAIMAANPEMSLRGLRALLKQGSIVRCLEWIRQHRYDGAR